MKYSRAGTDCRHAQTPEGPALTSSEGRRERPRGDRPTTSRRELAGRERLRTAKPHERQRYETRPQVLARIEPPWVWERPKGDGARLGIRASRRKPGNRGVEATSRLAGVWRWRGGEAHGRRSESSRWLRRSRRGWAAPVGVSEEGPKLVRGRTAILRGCGEAVGRKTPWASASNAVGGSGNRIADTTDCSILCGAR